jgi:hypothetical protein
LALLEEARLSAFHGQGEIVRADTQGRFSVPLPGASILAAERERLPSAARDLFRSEQRIVAVHESGFVQTAVADLGPAKALVLQPWAAIEGTLQLSGQPAPNQRIRVKNEAARPEGCLVPARSCAS